MEKIDENTLLDIFSGVEQINIKMEFLITNPDINSFLNKTNFFSSKSEINRAIKENSISINKKKVDSNFNLNKSDLICDKYILIQRGKKKYFLVIVE